jgi:hypothetical protein
MMCTFTIHTIQHNNMTFNGGKMLHIFKLTSNLYVDEFFNDAAKDALHNGKYYVKVDGVNHMVLKNGTNIELYARYDDKKGKIDPQNLPYGVMALCDGANPSEYKSLCQHHYYYKSCQDITGKMGKIYATLYKKIYTYFKEKPDGHYSIEVVGKKFQKTPGITSDAEICVHNDQLLDIKFQSYDNAKKYLLNDVCIEGVVIEHNGLYWKIRSNCFHKDNPYEKILKSQQIPDNFITPKVIML